MLLVINPVYKDVREYHRPMYGVLQPRIHWDKFVAGIYRCTLLAAQCAIRTFSRYLFKVNRNEHTYERTMKLAFTRPAPCIAWQLCRCAGILRVCSWIRLHDLRRREIWSLKFIQDKRMPICGFASSCLLRLSHFDISSFSSAN
jgi:hypothetical protein